jgi:UDP-N-acetylmuramate dehydrogenase
MSPALRSRLDALQGWLTEADIPFREEFPLAKLSQIKCGGTPRLLVTPQDTGQLQTLIQHLDQENIPRFVIGNLSNLLVRGGEILTVMISLKNLRETVFGDTDVRVDAGVLVPAFARIMESKGYGGFSGLYGVPASVGGAIFMNASCYGDETSRHLIDVTCLDERGRLCTLPKSALGFGWRHSAFHEHLRAHTIVSARFALVPNPRGSQDKLQSTEAEINRRTYQERTHPNLGSLFATRNIYGDLAASFPLYRALYLGARLTARLMPGDRHHNVARLSIAMTRRYFRIKDTTQVGLSPKTVNCVINRGDAQANDIIDFVKQVRRRMRDRLPFEIEILEDII